MEQWKNDTEWGDPKNLEENLLLCYLVHHQFNVDWPENEPSPP